MIALHVDGRAISVEDGASVLDAVLASGAHVPHLCNDPDQPAIGACRTCLVAIEGRRGLVASCHAPAEAGMRVATRGDALDRVRDTVLSLTESMVRSEAIASGDQARGTFQREIGQRQSVAYAPRPRLSVDLSQPAFTLSHDACILCARCVEACQDVQHIGAIAIAGTGREARVATFMDGPLRDSICTSCGQCVSVCPTGALMPNPAPPPVAKEVASTCPYCGVGCGVRLQVDASDRIVAVLDEPGNASSDGMLCVKGRFGTSYVHHPDRLTTPLIRRDGILQPASWDEALDLVAAKLVEHRGSFGALASAKATNEDNYVLQKFVRLLMGTNNIDHCSRLCHAPSVTAMLAQIGSGATSNSYADYERAGCLMVVGSDTSSNHPVIASRLRRAIERNGTRLIVVNPKRIDLCDYTDLWLRPNPGTDVALFNSIAAAVLDEGLEDRDFIDRRTEGFAEWRASLADYAPELTEAMTGVPAALVREAARLYARPPFSGSCLLWGMGITQHTCGTDNAHALMNLALATGQVGKPGNGISPLRGQNNVQGCGDVGCLPNTLPGFQGIGDQARAKFGAAWRGDLSADDGLTSTAMFEEAVTGRLACMFVMGENPLLSEPYLAHAREAVERLDFLAVQDIFMNETAELAHVVLPATSFAEKEGTFSNSERRVQRVRTAVPSPGDSRADWEIVADLARRVARLLARDPSQFDYASPSQIFDEFASLTPSYAGLSHARLDREGGIQYPCPAPDHPGSPQLFADSFPRGKGLFMPVSQGAPAAELPSHRFPYILNTGRVLYHWHGGTITTRARALMERSPELQIAVHPADAAKEAVADGDEIVVSSRRGEVAGRALVTDVVRRGEIFVPFVKLNETAANFVTNAAYDPDSGIPEFKVCAVRIDKPGAERPRGRRRMQI